MAYTVHQLASLAGVSVRTLHYYDEVGLLSPSYIEPNGYRRYQHKELLRLQQILFFRELEFSLEDIKHMLNSAQYNAVTALRDQQSALRLKQKHLQKLIKTIDTTINHMTHKTTMPDEELYNAFKDEDVKHYQAEVQDRWGNTEAYKQSMARVSKITKAEMQQLKDDGKKFTQKLADAMNKDIRSPEVQALIAEHYKGIQFFYDCPLEMYRNLGQMYVNDPRFTKYYDKFKPGLAVFVRDAIGYFVNKSRGNIE